MMKTTKCTSAKGAADYVGDEVEQLLTRLYSEEGIPVETVIAAAHGQIVAMLAMRFGGKVASDSCLAAAKLLEHLPSMVDATPPAAEPECRA